MYKFGQFFISFDFSINLFVEFNVILLLDFFLVLVLFNLILTFFFQHLLKVFFILVLEIRPFLNGIRLVIIRATENTEAEGASLGRAGRCDLLNSGGFSFASG
jgi:hypothetical protein